jgi:hypothetical protein
MTDLDPRWPRLLTAARLARANAIPRTSSLTKGPFDRLMEATAAFDADQVPLVAVDDEGRLIDAGELADRSPQAFITGPTLIGTPASDTGFVLVTPQPPEWSPFDADIAPGLLAALEWLGNDYGPLGVALVAASLTDVDALIHRLTTPPPDGPQTPDEPVGAGLCDVCAEQGHPTTQHSTAWHERFGVDEPRHGPQHPIYGDDQVETINRITGGDRFGWSVGDVIPES